MTGRTRRHQGRTTTQQPAAAADLPLDITDRLVWPLLTTLRSCAARQLGIVQRPVCNFPIVTGAQPPPADRCDCTCNPPSGGDVPGQGEAWIRHVLTRSVPKTATSGRQLPQTGCGGLSWNITVEIGVYRCWPTPTRGVNGLIPPTDADYDAASRGLSLDAAALRRAVTCCPKLNRQGKEIPYGVDQSAPMTPSGGCIGLLQTATFTRDDCSCPPGSHEPGPIPAVTTRPEEST